MGKKSVKLTRIFVYMLYNVTKKTLHSAELLHLQSGVVKS
jgi:hypothetical protein